MSELFAKKYRSHTTRLPSWDYSSPACYFITICTFEREPFFGQIVNATVCLTDLGKVVQEEWIKTPVVRPQMNVSLDEFIVMPDHFHALIIFGPNESNSSQYRTSVFGPQSNNLSSIIRGFKSAVTTRAKKAGHVNFRSQSLYFDHIIRNDKSLLRIKNYIKNNPANYKQRLLEDLINS